MAFLTGPAVLSDIDLYESSATRVGGLYVGQSVFGTNGDRFNYSLVGASALVMGNLLQNAADDTTYTNMAVGTAGAVGDRFLQITNGTATITSQQFEGGKIGVYTAGTVAVGDQYTILGVSGTLTTGGALTVAIDRPLRYAFTTSAKVVMSRNPWSGVIQAPATTQTGIPVGVAVAPSTAEQYAFVQTGGVATVLSDGSTFAIGSNVGTVSGTAGAITVYDAATTLACVGVAMKVAASGKGIPVLLQIQ